MTDVHTAVTCYSVSCVPPDAPDAHWLTLTVERRNVNPDRWAVFDGAYCYDAKGKSEYESSPSSRTDEFKDRFRHSLPDALALAQRIAPTMTVDGYTVEDVLKRINS